METKEQKQVLENKKQNMIVSASAGSGKTYTLIKYICDLVCTKRIPIRKFLILTFTKAAATEMKERLLSALKEVDPDDFIIKQIDDLSVSNISTIHSFCEYCLKKYANILKIDEDFEIADDNFANKLRSLALRKAIEKFKTENVDDMTEIEFAFKNNRKKVEKSIFSIENMCKVVEDKEEFIKRLLSPEKLCEEAEQYICEYIDDYVNRLVDGLCKMHLDDIAFELKKRLQNFLSANSLVEKTEKLSAFKFPTLPKKEEVSGYEYAILDKSKKNLEKKFDAISKIVADKELYEQEKKAVLESALIKLYVEYERQYENEKKNKKLLDFNDLEQEMLKLSASDVFKEDFEYVFVDEYQDTNFLQARIIKKIAKNINFVAVGDPKQGIYGFRLASADIFLKDVENFEKDENSNVVNLTTNFRSHQNVLKFVNDIFENVMIEDTTQIDYKKTSMLQPYEEFEEDDSPTVIVDVIKAEKEEREVKDVYSVRDDEVVSKISELELEAIKVRIEEFLSSKIYDKKLKKFRQVGYDDIAILSRSRSELYYALDKYLRKNGIPVSTSVKRELLETPEIKILLNLLKIALTLNDDVALLSVLMSNFGKFSQDDMIAICGSSDEKLTEIVQKNAKFAEFLANLNKFKQNLLCYGVKDALEILFEETHYYSYINSQGDANLSASVKQFLAEILNSGYNFDLPNLINYFESVAIDDNGAEKEKSSVLLTTIHATKGLEYPIVILIGCNKSFKASKVTKENKIPIKIDETLGIAVNRYEDTEESKSLKRLAIDLKEERKMYAEEMMLFYVALTRAKNKLYLVGEDNITPKFASAYDSYFDYVFGALGYAEIEKLVDEQHIEKGSVEYNYITDIEVHIAEKGTKDAGKVDKDIVDKIDKYLNFNYIYKNNENISFKNSVTALSKKFESDSVFIPSDEYLKISSNAIEVGNAYHLALKLIDFEKINEVKDVVEIFNTDEFAEIKKDIDAETLYNNIALLKNYTTGKVYKEKEFIIRDKLCNLVDGTDCDDEVMVQGVIDLFVVKENGSATLIDYKYSGERNDEKLKERYKNQLKMYKNAIKNGLFIDVDEIYLLNLKYNKIIKFDNL